MKKIFLSVLLFFATFSTVASATVLEQDFFNGNNIFTDIEAELFPYHSMPGVVNSSLPTIPAEVTVYDGKVYISGIDTGAIGSRAPFFRKTMTNNSASDGTTVISIDAETTATNSWTTANGNMLWTFYTGSETDGFAELFTISVGNGNSSLAVNGSNLLSTSRNSWISTSQPTTLGFSVDHEAETITALINGNEIAKSTPVTLSGVLKNKAITRIDISYKDAVSTGVFILDNFKITNTASGVTTTIVSEDFNNPAKALISDFGFNEGIDFFYRTDNSLGAVTPNKKDFLVKKSFNILPDTGLAIIEFKLDAFNSSGNNVEWISGNGQNSGTTITPQYTPMFALGNYTSDNDYEALLGLSAYNYGNREQCQHVTYIGTGSATNNTTQSGKKWVEITDFRLILDLDNKTYNIYFKDRTGEYVIFNKTKNLPFGKGEKNTIDTLWVGCESHASKYGTRFEISDLTIYTLTEDKPTPVIYDGTVELKSFTPGQNITVYAPMYAYYEFASLLVTAYDNEDRMIGCKFQDYPSLMLGYKLLKTDYAIPSNAEKLKVYFWDGLYDFIPYSLPAKLESAK